MGIKNDGVVRKDADCRGGLGKPEVVALRAIDQFQRSHRSCRGREKLNESAFCRFRSSGGSISGIEETREMATKKSEKKAVKKISKDIKKAVRKGVDEDVIEDAVEQGMDAAPKKKRS